MPKLLSQKGAVPPLAIAIVAVVLIGGVFLISQRSSQTPTSNQKQETSNQQSSTEIQWETYTDKQYGYSLKHPSGWMVENLESGGTRLIRVRSADKTAFVLIEGISGPALEDEKAMQQVVDYLEKQLKSKSEYKVTASSKVTEGGLSGYIAEGENVGGDITTLFEERFMVAKSGKGLRMHTEYSIDSKEVNKSITNEIMTSFKTN